MSDPALTRSVGIDVGGGTIRSVGFDSDGVVTVTDRRPTPTDPELLAAEILDSVDIVAADHTRDPELVVGIGIPGQVDEEHGVVCHAVNLGISGDGYPLRQALAGRGIRRVHLENDVNAAALGFAADADQWRESLALLNIGTGIAAGIVIDGKILRGHHRLAGEIGHIPMDPAGTLCVCGQIGCLETFASGTAIANALPAPQSSASDLAAARAQDLPYALVAWDRLVFGIAWAVHLLCFTVDVETVLLTGGVSRLGQPLLDSVREQLTSQANRSSILASADMSSRVAIAPEQDHVAPRGARLAAFAAGI